LNEREAGKVRGLGVETVIGNVADAPSLSPAFAGVDMDAVPTRGELDDIWAYMNYHLNFRRLFFEDRPKKLAQQFAYVENIARLVAPKV